MTSDPTDFTIRGAVPLDAPAAAPGGGTAQPGGAVPAVFDVTEATFEAEVLQRSLQVPVVVDFWASWCGPCKQLSPVLERLAIEARGAWVLAKVDVDANQRLAQAFGVQSIPMVIGVVGGRPVELFTGAVPEPQVRQVMEQVVALAAQMGVVGARSDVGGAAGAAEEGLPEEPLPAYVLEAEEALARGDVAEAERVYQAALNEAPGDERARSGLAYAQLAGRLQNVTDPEQVRRAAADRPDDVEAQLAAADVEIAQGLNDAGFDRLVALVRRTAGEERDRVRQRLLNLFDVAGPGESVARARRALTAALF